MIKINSKRSNISAVPFIPHLWLSNKLPHYWKKMLWVIMIIILGSTEMMGQKVFMTGDSHVFAKVYPNTVEETLKSEYPGIDFSYWAKNGICFYSFTSNPEYYDNLFSFEPDLLIVHLGTNGAYANNFTRKAFRAEMEKFYKTLTDSLPGVKVVFVTPFTNKKRKYKKKGRYYVNYKNREAANEIIAFVKDHKDTYVIDNNAEVGLRFLKSRTLIRPDNVHLTEAGYKELGQQVGREILQLDALWSSMPKYLSPAEVSEMEDTYSPPENYEEEYPQQEIDETYYLTPRNNN